MLILTVEGFSVTVILFQLYVDHMMGFGVNQWLDMVKKIITL